MADRDILFRIGIGAHPETAKRLNELAEAFKRTGLQAELAIGSVAEKAKRSAAEINAATVSVGGGRSYPSGGGVSPTSTLPTSSTGGSRITPRSSSNGGRGVGGFADSLGGLREETAKGAREAGEEAAKTVRKSYTDTIGRLAGLSAADMKTLLGADDQNLLALAENQADKYASGLRSALKGQLGLSGADADELFSTQTGDGLKQQQRDYAEETDRVSAALGEQLTTMESLSSEGDKLGKSLSSNFREVAQKGEEMASGLGQAASGLAFLFADSKDAKKLIDTLLTIKGTSDIVLGGFKAFSGVAQFFSLLGDRTKILAERQQNQADKTKLAGSATANYIRVLEREGIELRQAIGGNEQHAQALRRVAAAANQAAAAEARLNAQGGGTRGRGGIGETLLGAAGQGARGSRFGGLARGAASLLGGSAISSVTGGGFGGAIGGLGLDAVLYGGGGAAAGGTAGAAGVSGPLAALAAPAAAAAAALGSLALVGKEAQEIFSGTANQAGSLTDTIASTQASIFAWGLSFTGTSGIASAIGDLVGDFGVVSSTLGDFDLVGLSTIGAFGDLARSTEDLKKAQENAKTFQLKGIQAALTSDLTVIDRSAQQKIDDNRTRATTQQRALGVESGQLTGLDAARGNQADAARALSKELKVIADYEKGINTDANLYLSALERANVLTLKHEEAQKAVIAAVKAEAAERRALNDASIGAAEQRIGLIEKERGIYSSNQDKLEAAAVKFSRLDQRGKVETIEAQRVAESGGTLSRQQRGDWTPWD